MPYTVLQINAYRNQIEGSYCYHIPGSQRWHTKHHSTNWSGCYCYTCGSSSTGSGSAMAWQMWGSHSSRTSQHSQTLKMTCPPNLHTKHAVECSSGCCCRCAANSLCSYAEKSCVAGQVSAQISCTWHLLFLRRQAGQYNTAIDRWLRCE